MSVSDYEKDKRLNNKSDKIIQDLSKDPSKSFEKLKQMDTTIVIYKLLEKGKDVEGIKKIIKLKKHSPRVIVYRYILQPDLDLDILYDLIDNLDLYNETVLFFVEKAAKDPKALQVLDFLLSHFKVSQRNKTFLNFSIEALVHDLKLKANSRLVIFLKEQGLFFETGQESCSIKGHKLVKPCTGQKYLGGSKCYKNKCYKHVKTLSGNNVYGNVILVSINNKKYAVKWNKYKQNKAELLKEIKIQLKVQRLNLAPEIITYYYDANHYYILMDDLVSRGFVLLSQLDSIDLLKEFKKIIIDYLKILHKYNIVHGDLHANNIFVNTQTKQIKFIDFGRSEETSDATLHQEDLKKFTAGVNHLINFYSP